MFINDTPKYSINNNWLNILRFKRKKRLSSKIIKKFLNLKINVRPVWLPNHLQKPFKKFENIKLRRQLNYLTPAYATISTIIKIKRIK